MRERKFADAIQLYRELSQALPANVGLRKNLGLALFSAGQYGEAAPVFETVLKSQPADIPVWFLLGMTHIKRGAAEHAIPALSKAVEAEPANAMYRYELADALNGAGRPGEALPHFVRLSQLQPANADAWFGMGNACLQLSRDSAARLEETAPESGYWYALLARSRLEQKELRSAFYFFRQALSKVPNLPGVHEGLSRIYEESGHPDWAAVEAARERSLPRPADTLLEMTGATPEILYWRARILSQQAEQAFARVLELPPSAARHRLRADGLRLQKRYAESAGELREALKLAPGNQGILLELAKTLRLNQDYKGAEPLLESLVAGRNDWFDGNFLLGDNLLAMQDAGRAIPYLEKAVRLKHDSREAHADLGRAFLQTGDSAKAAAHLEAALPGDADGNLHYLLAQAYRRSGREELSKHALEQRRSILAAEQARAAEHDRLYVVTPPD